MEIILRIIGGLWILLALRPVWFFIRHLLQSGLPQSLPIQDILYTLLLAGGIGLLLLKEWGRWLIVIACSAFLLLLIGPGLLRLQFHSEMLRPMIYYGIFLVILLMPQARSSTHK